MCWKKGTHFQYARELCQSASVAGGRSLAEIKSMQGEKNVSI